MQTIYIGNTLVNDIMLGNQRMDDFTQKISVPTNGLVYWLDGNTYVTGSTRWFSSTGSLSTVTGSINTSTTPPVKTSYGTIEFTKNQCLDIQPYASLDYTSTNYTLIVIGRYIGSSSGQGRLFIGGAPTATTVNRNYLLGTYNTNTVAAYNSLGGYTFGPSGSYDTTFRMYTISTNFSGTDNSKFYLNNELLANVLGTTRGPQGGGINSGSYGGGTGGGQESSNCEVGDILFYNRILSDTEVNNVYLALGPKYGI